MTEHTCIFTHTLAYLVLNVHTYLHADLVEHQARCVVEETVSFPTELHGVLLHFMQH